MKNTEYNTHKLKTGVKAFDDMLGGGLNIPSLNMICARPGMGKTSFALQLIQNIAKESGKIVCFFTLDNTTAQIKSKLALPNDTSDLNIIIDDTPLISVADMLQKIADRENLGLVVIDYLQLICSDNKMHCRKEEMENICRELKDLSRNLSLPVVVTSQACKIAEYRENHRPLISDLDYTGDVEKYFDTIAFLYRENYYDQNADDSAEIIVAKNGYGDTGTINMKWDDYSLKFLEKN